MILIIFIKIFNQVLEFQNNLTFNLFLFTIVVSTISQVGDLSISYFKRKAKIKDTGSIIPGHGGLLDRIDGMIVAYPLSIMFLPLIIIK